MSCVLKFRVMMHAQASALDPLIRQVLKQTQKFKSPEIRIEALSRRFLGLPYIANPLRGSAGEREIFTATLGGFDCVTYVETVLAMSRASGADEFLKCLRLIRYEHGRVEWKSRNHHMVFWIRSNVRQGVVRRLFLPAQCVTKSRVLSVVPGLAPMAVEFRCIPKGFLPKISDRILTGDIIFFASTRSHLDVFHCGIIVRNHDHLLLRHASRSRKGVVEQKLSEFLKDNRMAGVILVRPT